LEDNLYNSFKLEKNNYLDEVILGDDFLHKTQKLLYNKNTIFNLVWESRENSFLLMYDNKKHKIWELKSNLWSIVSPTNLVLSLSDIVKNGFDTSISIFKISNKKILELFKHDIDLSKFFKWEVRWRWSSEKIDTIFDNLDSELLPLVFMIYKKRKDLGKIEKLKTRLDQLNWKKGSINKDFYRWAKLEVRELAESENNKIEYGKIIELFNNNPKEAKKILITWYNTKKERYLFDDFISFLSEKRWAWTKNRDSNILILGNIITKIIDETNKSKNTNLILRELIIGLNNNVKSINTQNNSYYKFLDEINKYWKEKDIK